MNRSDTVLLTPRLALQRFDADDADDHGFLRELLNQDSFLRNIGDRGVHSDEDAARYVREGPQASYERHGHGLWRMVRRSDGLRLGMCGLLQRDWLPDPDLGYALLDRHAGHGYAREAATATLEFAWRALQRTRVAAIVSPANAGSIRLLVRLGFRSLGLIDSPQGSGATEHFVVDRPSG